jgi:hypothetical protein
MNVDYDLISEARALTTGANVHMVKTWIFCYESSFPNTPRRERYETLLRDFVATKRLLNSARAIVDGQRELLSSLTIAQNATNRQIEKLLSSSSD